MEEILSAYWTTGTRKNKGIYSPITQNRHHLELMKKIKKDSKGNILSKALLDQTFNKRYKSIVVLANPQTIVDYRYAKKEIREQIVRSDRLIEYIKQSYKESNLKEVSDGQMAEWAKSYLELHIEAEKDYISKYDRYKVSQNENADVQPNVKICGNLEKAEERNFYSIDNEIEKTEIFQRLKAFRLRKAGKKR